MRGGAKRFVQEFGRKQLGKETLGYASAKLAPGLQTVVIAVILLRTQGAEYFGRYSLGFAIALVVASLSSGWLRQSILRFSSHTGGWSTLPATIHIGTVILPLIVTGVLAAIIMKAGLFLSISFGFLSASMSLILIATSVLMTLTRVRQIVFLETLRSIAATVLPILLVILGWADLQWVVLSIALSSLPYAIFYLRLRRSRQEHCQRNREVWRWWRYGWPLSVWLGLGAIASNVDRFAIALVLGDAVLGKYAALNDAVGRTTALVLLSISQATVPRVMNAWNSRKTVEASRLLRTSIRIQIVMSAFMIIGSIVFAAPIGWVVLGESAPALLVGLLVLMTCLWQLTSLAQLPLALKERTKLIAATLLVAMVFMVPLTFAFTILWGPTGSAAAASIGVLGYLVVISYQTKRSTEKGGETK